MKQRVQLLFTILSQAGFLLIGFSQIYWGLPPNNIGLLIIMVGELIVVCVFLFSNRALAAEVDTVKFQYTLRSQCEEAATQAAMQACIRDIIRSIQGKIELESNITNESILKIDTTLKLIEVKLDPEKIVIRKSVNGSTSPHLSAVIPAADTTTTGNPERGTSPKRRGRRGANTEATSSNTTVGTDALLATDESARTE